MDMSPFGPCWCIGMLLMLIALIVITVVMKHKSSDTKTKFMKIFGIAAITVFVLYKIWLFIDADYEADFWNELPLNLCNLCVLFAYLSLTRRFDFLQPFLFFFCFPGTIAGLMLADEAYTLVPFWHPRSLGFFLSHEFGLMFCVLLVTIGIYRPKKTDVLKSALLMAVVGFIIHLANTGLRLADLNIQANYCYTYGLPGNVMVDMLWNIIPVPLLYYLPVWAFVTGVEFALCLIIGKIKERKHGKLETN